MPTSGVRLARTSDVDDVAAINVQSWRQRFPGLLPAEALAAMAARDLAVVWASGILNPPTPGHRLLVAVDADHVVGYVAFGPGADPDADPGTAELVALEVDPDHQRRGHGSRLLAAMADHARSAGMDTVVAWCLLDDQPRRAFLQQAGWMPDSAFRDLATGDEDLPELREVRLVVGLHDVADR